MVGVVVVVTAGRIASVGAGLSLLCLALLRRSAKVTSLRGAGVGEAEGVALLTCWSETAPVELTALADDSRLAGMAVRWLLLEVKSMDFSCPVRKSLNVGGARGGGGSAAPECNLEKSGSVAGTAVGPGRPGLKKSGWSLPAKKMKPLKLPPAAAAADPPPPDLGTSWWASS